jgi:hypothetical protein
MIKTHLTINHDEGIAHCTVFEGYVIASFRVCKFWERRSALDDKRLITFKWSDTEWTYHEIPMEKNNETPT